MVLLCCWCSSCIEALIVLTRQVAPRPACFCLGELECCCAAVLLAGCILLD